MEAFWTKTQTLILNSKGNKRINMNLVFFPKVYRKKVLRYLAFLRDKIHMFNIKRKNIANVDKKFPKSHVWLCRFSTFTPKWPISVWYWGACNFYNNDLRIKFLYAKFMSNWCPIQWYHPQSPVQSRFLRWARSKYFKIFYIFSGLYLNRLSFL